MPWPAKPPMTLKEAKRAYKKEGATVRYTPSQMARADRIDAKEEKRKKELEKGRQRAENKRKREEKEDRERRVRQKMLDEGRISVEDTWGKVTASQPRLNKFFGQKPAAAPARSNLSTAVAADEEKRNPSDGSAAGSQDKEDSAHEVQDAPQQDMPAAMSETTQGTASSQQKNAPSDFRDDAPSRPIRREFFSSADSQPSALRELRPSQINARSSASARSLRGDKHEPSPKPVVTPRMGVNVDIQHDTITPKVSGRSSGYMLSSSGSNTISEGSPTELLPEMATINQNGRGHGHDESLHQGSPSENKEQTATPKGGLAPSLDLTDEEDFTDGIDDETFLLLCATQRPAKDPAPSHQHSPPKGSTMSTFTGTSPKREASRAPEAEYSRTDSVGSIPHGLSESFTSVFNEFEDEDLIALAEEVESGAATPKQTPSVTPVEEAKRLKPQPLARQPIRRPRDFAKPQIPTVRLNVPGLAEVTAKCMPPAESRRQGASSETPASAKPQPQAASSWLPQPRPGVALIPPMTSSRPPVVRRDWQAIHYSTRTTGTNPQALGTNPRALGANPKAIHPATTAKPNHVSQSAEKTEPPPPPPPPQQRLPKKRIWPKDMLPVDEFPGLGPSTQALSLELLEQFEAQVRNEESKGGKIGEMRG